MSNKAKWTEQRVQRLFGRYNKTYWRGNLPPYAVRVRKLEGCLGICFFKEREIVIDTNAHKSDRKSVQPYSMKWRTLPLPGKGMGINFGRRLSSCSDVKLPSKSAIQKHRGFTFWLALYPGSFLSPAGPWRKLRQQGSGESCDVRRICQSFR